MDDLTLILCDAKQEPIPRVRSGRFYPIRNDLHALSSAEWNDLANAASTEWFALTRSADAIGTEEWEQCRKLFQSHPQLKMVLFFSLSQDDAVAAWQKLPIRVAALRQNWARDIQAVIYKTTFIKGQGFADTPDPIWNVLIQSSIAPESIRVMQSANDTSSASSRQNSDLPGLTPKPPGASRRWLKTHLESLTLKDLVPNATSHSEAIALKAGLFQIHDDLHESHELSQSIEGEGRNRAGDYWHAIMHRREPDYGNAKYWFRHVGQHPIFAPLRIAVDGLLQQIDNSAGQHARQRLLSKNQWDPFAFVDFCQECERCNDPNLTRIAQEIQWQEMCLLLEQTYRDSTA